MKLKDYRVLMRPAKIAPFFFIQFAKLENEQFVPASPEDPNLDQLINDCRAAGACISNIGNMSGYVNDPDIFEFIYTMAPSPHAIEYVAGMIVIKPNYGGDEEAKE